MKLRTQFLIATLLLSLYGQIQGQEPSNSSGPNSNSGTAAESKSGALDHSYVIGKSDVLTVTVWKQPNLSGSLLVRPDGKISMPLLGDVQAAGLTPMHLAARIGQDLKQFMKDPDVSVVVSHIHKNFVYLLGEVGKKGPVVMTPGMTLLEALSCGGGLTVFAHKSKIYILRQVNHKQKKIRVNYKKALKGDAGYNVALMPGDTIVVP